jgi:hypothetical protein
MHRLDIINARAIPIDAMNYCCLDSGIAHLQWELRHFVGGRSIPSYLFSHVGTDIISTVLAAITRLTTTLTTLEQVSRAPGPDNTSCKEKTGLGAITIRATEGPYS